MIALEMMEDTVHAPRALEAALETSLPVWLGVSCKKSEDGRIVSFAHDDLDFSGLLETLIPSLDISQNRIGTLST